MSGRSSGRTPSPSPVAGADAPVRAEADVQPLAVMPAAGPEGPPALPVESRIGPYRLVRVLGHGSAGQVYEVEHEKIGRRAAMKVLSPEHTARPDALRRLLAEAQAVNRINNPHIVEITDIVEGGTVLGPDRRPLPGPPVNAIVMELLEGCSLQHLMTAGQVPPERFLPIMAQACDALAAAHGAGFVHRDLKPDNIFVLEQGDTPDFVKLLDFGIAKPTAEHSTHSTVETSFVGTPAYVSPEQAASRAVDHRADLYAVGVMLYEMAAGRLPFEGDNIGEFLVKHLTVPPPRLPPELLGTKLGRYLNAVVQRCLQKDPVRRFASAGELAGILRTLARGEIPSVAGMDEYLQRSAAGAGRRVLAYGGVWLGLALVTGLALHVSGLWSSRHHTVAEPPEPFPPPATGAPATGGAPAAAAAPRAPVRDVTLVFESEPPGAEARLQGRSGLVGITPFVQSFPRSAQPLVIDVKLAGHRPRQLVVVPDEDHTLSVRLQKLGPVPRGPRPGTPARSRTQSPTKESTIDPFAK